MQLRNCISLILLSLTLHLAHAAPRTYAEYRITVVGPAHSRPIDINNAGAVVGIYPASPTTIRAFLHRGKGFIDLSMPDGTSSDARAINDRGEVLGNWVTRRGQQRGYLYASGKQRDLGTLPGRPTIWIDINNAGYLLALGGASGPSAPAPRSILRDPRGKLQDIGKPPFDKPVTQAHALNNRNQVAGRTGPLVFSDQPWHAVLWRKGGIRDLGDLGSEPNSGVAINDRGQVTGEMSATTGFTHRAAFLYSNGRLLNIDGRPPLDGRFSSGKGINNHGHIVGSSDHLGAFVYRGKRMQGLNGLIDPKLGWTIQSPQAINDAGQIAAVAVRKGVRYAVRLDLIRPHGLAAPVMGKDEDD